MEVEMNGLRNILTACQEHGVRRLIYVTSLGIAPDAPSVWLRGRWETEQFLLNTGLDVTVLRPGQIVGVGGCGFDTMLSQAKRPVAINLLGRGPQKERKLLYEKHGLLDTFTELAPRGEFSCGTWRFDSRCLPLIFLGNSGLAAFI
jgi:nucleoside-diphosphate-sugar epimerase